MITRVLQRLGWPFATQRITKGDEEGLNKIGERIFNLQRAIRMREGWGGRHGDRLLDAFHDIPKQDDSMAALLL